MKKIMFNETDKMLLNYQKASIIQTEASEADEDTINFGSLLDGAGAPGLRLAAMSKMKRVFKDLADG